jgi:hypothetical protein
LNEAQFFPIFSFSRPRRTKDHSMPISLDPDPQPAPQFPDGLDWLNADQPLQLSDLRGSFVLLDFWSYG